MRSVVLIVHNVRSAHNVGSLLRTADGLGINAVYLTGYTPYPEQPDDRRLPHERRKTASLISKTALGAEASVEWRHYDELDKALDELRRQGYAIVALEQTPGGPLALLVGNEVEGLDEAALKTAETKLYIPMLGQKESFNVAVAAAMALYDLRHKA